MGRKGFRVGRSGVGNGGAEKDQITLHTCMKLSNEREGKRWSALL